MGLKALRALPKLTVLKTLRISDMGGNQRPDTLTSLRRLPTYRLIAWRCCNMRRRSWLTSTTRLSPEKPVRSSDRGDDKKTTVVRSKGGMPLYKYVGNRILSVFENYALDLNLTEFHSGYRAYNLHALNKLDFTQMTDDFHFDTEIIIKLQHQRNPEKSPSLPTTEPKSVTSTG